MFDIVPKILKHLVVHNLKIEFVGEINSWITTVWQWRPHVLHVLKVLQLKIIASKPQEPWDADLPKEEIRNITETKHFSKLTLMVYNTIKEGFYKFVPSRAYFFTILSPDSKVGHVATKVVY